MDRAISLRPLCAGFLRSATKYIIRNLEYKISKGMTVTEL